VDIFTVNIGQIKQICQKWNRRKWQKTEAKNC